MAAGEAEVAGADGVIKGRPEIVEAVAAVIKAAAVVVDIKAAAVDIRVEAAAVDIKVAAAVDIKVAAVVAIKAAAAVVIKAAAEVKLEQKSLADFLKTKISNKFRKIACKFARECR